MSDNYVIEIRPPSTGITVQAGLVVRDGDGFRFFAASRAFFALEGEMFKNPRAAEHAALQRATALCEGSSSRAARNGAAAMLWAAA